MQESNAGRARRPGRASCCSGSPRAANATPGEFAQIFRALGDDTRLAIVALLAADGGDLCACEIESQFALSQPTVSHHLRLLREAGVVTAERRGTWVHYTLAADLHAKLRSFATLLRR